jgi:Tfp pilus assembly protein PilO
MMAAWRKRAPLLAVLAVLLAANLAFFLWYRSTSGDRRQAAEATRVALTRDVEQREQEAAKLVAQRDRLSQVSSAIEDFYGRRVGSRRDTLAAVIADLHAILQKSGIVPAQISYAPAPVPDLPLTSMRINFGFRSDYLRFKEFVGAIESGRRWIVVREVGLQRDTDIPGSVQVRVALVTYFGADAPGAGAGPIPRIAAAAPVGAPR